MSHDSSKPDPTSIPRLRLILAGSTGRMGCELMSLVQSDQTLNITACINRKSPLSCLKTQILSAPDAFDILIDFSDPACTSDLIQFVDQCNKPILVGTTGLSESTMEKIKESSTKIPILVASNTSTAIALMHRLVEQGASLLGSSHSIHIDEVHHAHKKDSPSGTARSLARTMRLHCSAAPEDHQITSERRDDIPGTHTVMFTSGDDQLIIQHSALSRSLFARGAIEMAHWLAQKPPGLYGPEDWMKQALDT